MDAGRSHSHSASGAARSAKVWQAARHPVSRAGTGGLIMSLMSTDMLPTAAWIGFLSGIGLYFVQFVVFALQKPDPLPEILGHRELQHAILLLASGLHLFVAAIYL